MCGICPVVLVSLLLTLYFRPCSKLTMTTPGKCVECSKLTIKTTEQHQRFNFFFQLIGEKGKSSKLLFGDMKRQEYLTDPFSARYRF